MDLTKAGSACNTAGADGKVEEALSGLARGFFYAGSRSLLVTHWSVESESAMMLRWFHLPLLEREAFERLSPLVRFYSLDFMRAWLREDDRPQGLSLPHRDEEVRAATLVRGIEGNARVHRGARAVGAGEPGEVAQIGRAHV